MIEIVKTKPNMKILNTWVTMEILNDIGRIKDECSHVQKITKSQLIREALSRGLAQIEQEIKAQAQKNPLA